MLLGRDNIIQIVDTHKYLIRVRDIHSQKRHYIDGFNDVNIINHRHCRAHRVMVQIETECGKSAIIGKTIYIQVVDEGVPRIVRSLDLAPGMIICPPIPDGNDRDLWVINHGVVVKKRHLVLSKASHIIFDECEFVVINGIPLLHDNSNHRFIRLFSRISLRLSRLGLK